MVASFSPERISVQPIADKWWSILIDRNGGECIVGDPEPYDAALATAQSWELPVFVARAA